MLANITQQANTARPCLGLYPSREDWAEARAAAEISSTAHEDMHAGELETSILLATHPEYLRHGWQHDDHTAHDRRHMSALSASAYTSSGVIGLPSRATADKGHATLRHLGARADTILNILTHGIGSNSLVP